MTTIQKITAALRELLAETPDLDEVRGIVADLPLSDLDKTAEALVQLAYAINARSALARVKAGAAK